MTPDSRELRPVFLPDDLEKAFRLRYEVFQPMGVIPEKYLSRGTRMEVDALDRKSVPFGCFLERAPHEIIAHARLITVQRQEKYAEMTEEIVRRREDQELSDALDADYYSVFPLLESVELLEFERTLLARGLARCELSRVAVREDWRGKGVGKEMVRYVIDSVQELDDAVDVLILVCGLDQEGFYASFGFQPLTGAAVNVRRVERESRAMYLCITERGKELNLERTL